MKGERVGKEGGKREGGEGDLEDENSEGGRIRKRKEKGEGAR